MVTDSPDAGDSLLTVEDGGAVRGLSVQNLPYVIVYVADASNGDALVLTESMQPFSVADERLFYGKPGEMVQYPLLSDDPDCCETFLTFKVGEVQYTAHIVFSPDPGTIDGPSSLEIGTETLGLTLRKPTPTNLDGFAFTCSGT